MKYDVFISHSSKDKTIADAICHYLEEQGIACWIAPRDILPGNGWAESIDGAIKGCRAMVLVYTQSSNQSTQVGKELTLACACGKTIIPFLVDDTPMSPTMNYYLCDTHWLVAYPDYRQRLVPLLESVCGALGEQPIINQSTTPAPMTKTKPRPYWILAVAGFVLIALAVWLLLTHNGSRSTVDSPSTDCDSAEFDPSIIPNDSVGIPTSKPLQHSEPVKSSTVKSPQQSQLKQPTEPKRHPEDQYMRIQHVAVPHEQPRVDTTRRRSVLEPVPQL